MAADGPDVRRDVEKQEACFLRLADELIDLIFSNELLDYQDLCRCSEVCTRFYEICRSQELWKKKALQRWKFWKHSGTTGWLQCFKMRRHAELLLSGLLHSLTRTNYLKGEVTSKDFQELECIVDRNNGALFGYTKDTLLQIAGSDPRMANLTDRYYAQKLLGGLTFHQLRRQWRHFLSLPVEEQHVEGGAVLISRWVQCNTEVEEADVDQQLNEIANLVRRTCEECVTESPVHNSKADPGDCQKILRAIRKVLFEDLKFTGNSADYYHIANSLIDKVLEKKTGNPISLSVIFVAIARRLGVTVEPVNFPSHFLLRWRSNYEDPEADNPPTYIDCFNGARFMTREECLESFETYWDRRLQDSTLFPKATTQELFCRIMANIINSYRILDAGDDRFSGLRNALELLLLLRPGDYQHRILQARLLVHLEVDLEKAIESLEDLQKTSEPRGIPRLLSSLLERAKEIQQRTTSMESIVERKLRSDPSNAQVAYKIGMVMRHRRYHYGCVIYGWDPVCKMGESWIRQMGVDGLENGRHQPFYNVLGDDGSNRYASQESLQEEPGQDFNPHPEVGQHFEAFTGTRYVPNEALQARYPEDLFDNVDQSMLTVE